jgi:hypothetical protein
MPEIESSNFVSKYDFILDTLLVAVIPDCNMDQYSKTLNVSISDFILNNS